MESELLRCEPFLLLSTIHAATKETLMPDIWTNLPIEVQASIVLVGLWALDAIATRTPNPLDNLIVRGLKMLWAKRNTDRGA